MNKLTIYPIAVALAFACFLAPVSAQFNVSINVLNGTSTTTCTDPIGAPDPQWAVRINNGAWVSYPFNGLCYTNFPNQQFSQTYDCLPDIPATIPVCFRAYENDASIFDPCTPVYSCQAELCINVPVPPMGTVPFTIALPAGGPSGGSVNMNIAVSGVPGGINDDLCNAIPLGLLQTNIPVGLLDTSIFNNFCATNVNEPDPGPLGGGWFNNQGVWFTFTTGPTPSDVILVEANSDPSNFGDPVNLQVAVFESSDNTCAGSFTFLSQNHSPIDFNEAVVLSCPKPNTTYFVLVDGVFSFANNIEVEGWFGLQVTQLDVLAASELRCTAENIGTVPLGGSISSPLRTNACSMNTNASPNSSFGVQKSVWFTFTPPPTGHVFLQGTSSSIDPIELQIAVYRSSTGGCTGMVEVASHHTAADLDELIELHCLDPNATYFIMVDGALAALNTGIFTLTLTDAGNETPTTSLTPVVCFGETFAAGGNTYNQTGIYYDTLQLVGGCDSIVITDLTVLSAIQFNLQVVTQGVGLGNPNGQVQVAPTGGAGGYSLVWSDGQTGNLATNLIGGDNYCVEVTDQNGCQNDTCFVMPFYVNFIPSATGSAVLCLGDQTGTIEFSALGGVPPYQFEWSNTANTVSGSGFIPVDGQVIQLTGLPGGEYSVHISDIAFDTTLWVTIFEPTELTVSITNQTDATCAGDCDGAISVSVLGGTPPYQFSWSNSENSSSITNLCAGNYSLTVTDNNGCTATLDTEIEQPPVFSAVATEVQPVSCFQGSDGRATVTTSANAVTYLWSNGESSANINNLSGGIYTVTATNAAGCTAVASVLVTAPTQPVSVAIAELQGIACMGDNTGELQATPSGPGSLFTFTWSNGSIQSMATGLVAGNYSVTISNEKGCTATASANLLEPTDIQAEFTTNEITCLDAADGGIISILQVTGGNPPYTYSADGSFFGQDTDLMGYAAGTNSFFVQDAGGCVKEFMADIVGPAELVIDLGNDKTIDIGDSVKLQLTSSEPLSSYLWSPIEGLSCTDCSSPIVAPISSGSYSVTVTTADGCTASDEIFITVNSNQNVYIPNAFSPNNDGLNDEFMPFTGSSVRSIKSFIIFDRQGNQVFESKNMLLNQPGAGWNGEFRGKAMQPAVFVWLAEIEFFDGKVQRYSGDVTLVK